MQVRGFGSARVCADLKPRGANEGCRGRHHERPDNQIRRCLSIGTCGGYIYLDRQGIGNFWRDGYSKMVMVGVCRLTDYLLVNCAVSAEERWSLGIVDVESDAWWFVTSQQQNYFNTKPTYYTIS